MGIAQPLADDDAFAVMGFGGEGEQPAGALSEPFAVSKPAREVLFTVVRREDRYKSKNFIDTAVYRGGDAASGWLYTALGAIGLGVTGIAALCVPLAALWLLLGLVLGRRVDRHRSPAD